MTIGGESAGAFSICSLLAVNPSSTWSTKGLFRKAIMESVNCDSPLFFYQQSDADKWSEKWAYSIGCDKSKFSADKDWINCLQNTKLETLKVGIQYSTTGFNSMPSWTKTASNASIADASSFFPYTFPYATVSLSVVEQYMYCQSCLFVELSKTILLVIVVGSFCGR